MLDQFQIVMSSSTTLWLVFGALVTFAFSAVIGSMTLARSQTAADEFERKSALLPSFNALQAAESSLQEARRDREQIMSDLRELRRELADAERHKLDAEHWQAMAQEAKREYDSKQDIIAEVEGLKRQFEEAAADLAARNEELTELNRERSRMQAEIEATGQRLADLQSQVSQAEDLTARIDALKREREDLIRELEDIKDQREDRLRAAIEVDQLNRRLEELRQEREDLPDALENLRTQHAALVDKLDELRRETERLRETRDERDRLQAQMQGLQMQIEALERRKEELENAMSTVGVRADGTGTETDDETKLADLLHPPLCLFEDEETLWPDPIEEDDEMTMLERVADYLNRLNLDFDRRVIDRFHTSLKTGFISPLTVLAGISGTGKSQLPQRYAEAMGMHFLKVAVQPRWDSPQDLLGFYNYLEQSYKATELSRALIRMDPTFPLLEPDEQTSDHMLLVLLDEMNLARVEYYFSEFLSRLEGRPIEETVDEDLLRAGRIPFDVPSTAGETISVYPGHNVLFVGTMNEDESTQALSDKVLDRANTLRFRRPDRLSAHTMQDVGLPQKEHLPVETWAGWRKLAEDLDQPSQERVEEIVGRLNDHLATIERPFGFRVNQAIHAYVANYPDLSSSQRVDVAIADMFRLRILPKLRGIELEDRVPRELRAVAELIESELRDDELADSVIQGLANRDVFNWTG